MSDCMPVDTISVYMSSQFPLVAVFLKYKKKYLDNFQDINLKI